MLWEGSGEVLAVQQLAARPEKVMCFRADGEDRMNKEKGSKQKLRVEVSKSSSTNDIEGAALKCMVAIPAIYQLLQRHQIAPMTSR
jgi:hypothetical protein